MNEKQISSFESLVLSNSLCNRYVINNDAKIPILPCLNVFNSTKIKLNQQIMDLFEFETTNFNFKVDFENKSITIDYHCPQHMAMTHSFNMSCQVAMVNVEFTSNWFGKKRHYIDTFIKGTISGNVQTITEYNDLPYDFINAPAPINNPTINMACIYVFSPESCPIGFKRVQYTKGTAVDVYELKDNDYNEMMVYLTGSSTNTPILLNLKSIPESYYLNFVCDSYQHAVIQELTSKIYLEVSYINLTIPNEISLYEFCINDQ